LKISDILKRWNFLLCYLLTQCYLIKIVDPKTGEEKKIVVSADDGIRADTSLAVLSKLKPAFSKDGTTTAGN
jgi:acetyl-CoA acyltransferase 1